MKQKAVIFDLDGTLCDPGDRRKYVQHEPKNWEAFNAACVNDKPTPHVVLLHDMIIDQNDHVVLYSSGRSAKYWDDTVTWLNYNVKRGEQGPVSDRLHMRAEDDRRPDNIVKKEMLDKFREDYDIVFAVDDRDQVVEMWRENGVPCFQCNPGNF